MGTHFHQDVFYRHGPCPWTLYFFFIRILISVLFFISLTAAVIEISYALSRPPGFNGHLVRKTELFHWKKDPFSSSIKPKHHKISIFQIGIVLCTCCALLVILCVVKFAVYFSSPEQRAKVSKMITITKFTTTIAMITIIIIIIIIKRLLSSFPCQSREPLSSMIMLISIITNIPIYHEPHHHHYHQHHGHLHHNQVYSLFLLNKAAGKGPFVFNIERWRVFSNITSLCQVMPYMGFNTQAVVTSRARLGLSKNWFLLKPKYHCCWVFSSNIINSPRKSTFVR